MEQQPGKQPQNRPDGQHDLWHEGLQIASPAMGIAFIFLIAIVLQALADSLIRRTVPALASEAWYTQVLSSLMLYALAMPFSGFIFRLGESDPPPKARMSGASFFWILCLCFGLTYLGNLIGTLVNALLGAAIGMPIANELADTAISSPVWVNLIFIGILPPIMEELFFRKMVIDRLRRYGDLPAILLSGTAFALIHGNFSQLFYAFALGCLFGYIYLNTGHIWYTVVLHLCINLVGGVFAAEVTKRMDAVILFTDPIAAFSADPVGACMVVLYYLFMLATSVCAIIALCRRGALPRYSLRRAENPMQARQWVRVLLCNPAVWLFLLTVLILFL